MDYTGASSASILKTGWMHLSNNDSASLSTTAIGAPNEQEWTMSRYGSISSDLFVALPITSDGIVSTRVVSLTSAARPVFYLITNTKVSSGDGTIENPYILVDPPPTNNSISINSGATYTTSSNVTLTLTSIGAKEMCISNTSSCTDWVTYASSKSHTLTTGLGTKTVYVYFKDAAGNTSSVVSDTISLYESLIVPSQNGTITYTGNSQTPKWNNYDSNKMTIGGTTSGTNAGSYSAIFTPKTNYIWSDGSTDTKNVTWTIIKAKGAITISSVTGGTLSANSYTVVFGETVTLTASPSSGYIYGGATMSYTEDGNSVTKSLAYNELTFTMPEGDVTITPKWAKPTVTTGYYEHVLLNEYGNDNGNYYVRYSISYNPVSNQSTITYTEGSTQIGAHQYASSIGYYTSVTAKATDSGNSVTSGISLSGDKGEGYTIYYVIPSPQVVTVQHSNTVGTKYITISASTTYWYPYVDTSGSGSKTITVGTYAG